MSENFSLFHATHHTIIWSKFNLKIQQKSEAEKLKHIIFKSHATPFPVYITSAVFKKKFHSLLYATHLVTKCAFSGVITY